jgi:two-component system, sensor histidine kinase and response regulator
MSDKTDITPKNSSLRSIFSKQEFIYTIFIIPAFALLVFICSWFMVNIERRHIINDAKSALDTTELNIITDIKELENMLVSISETIRMMILQGGNYDTVTNYISYITKYLFADEKLKQYTTGVYGIFDVYDNKFYDGTGWIPPNDFKPKDRPWYKTAVEANGKSAVTEPYLSIAMDIYTMTFTRRIFNEENKPLGVICLDIVLERVKELVINTNFSHSGYGILLNKELEVLAHPNNELLGKKMTEINSSYSSVVENLKKGIPVSDHRIINYKGEISVAFSRQLENGWYIAVIIPENSYFKETGKMRLTVFALGTVLAALFVALVVMLYKAQKKLQYFELSQLTTRETEIYKLLLTNLSVKEIAQKLDKSYSGVSFHIQNLYRKLGVQSREDLLTKFVKKPLSE